MSKAPLILTVSIEEGAFDYFNNLRRLYFPPERNFIDAHITMFHALPNIESIAKEVEAISGSQLSFSIKVLEPVSIGKGVAFRLESGELTLLHKTLQQKWSQFLSPQDAQKLWPHITIQNKVAPAEAKELLLKMKEDFSSFFVQAQGLQLWEYLNGPWKLVRQFRFKDLQPLSSGTI